MSDFVRVTIPDYLSADVFRSRLFAWRDDALESAGEILETHSQASVRERFYRTGAALGSLDEAIVEKGLRKSYQQFSELFYFRFGEFGTGVRGRESDVPRPAGYRYGRTAGMSARFMLGTAIERAEPEIVSEFRRFTKQLPRRITSGRSTNAG